MGHSHSSIKGKFITVNAYIKKRQRKQSNNLPFHLNNWIKKKKKNPEQAESRK